MSQPALERARSYQKELVGIRHDIHAHPELGLEEVRTADLVAKKLEEWGIEVHRGVGVTGVVGVLRNGNGHGRLKLHADIAHPINAECRHQIEQAVLSAYHNELERSKQPGYVPPSLDGEDFEFYDDPSHRPPEVRREWRVIGTA